MSVVVGHSSAEGHATEIKSGRFQIAKARSKTKAYEKGSFISSPIGSVFGEPIICELKISAVRSGYFWDRCRHLMVLSLSGLSEDKQTILKRVHFNLRTKIDQLFGFIFKSGWHSGTLFAIRR